MIINSIKELKIQYDEASKLVRIEWVVGGDIRRLRSSLDQLNKVIEQFHSCLAILDLCHLPDISAYDQIWIGTHWMPKVWSLSLKQVSIVIPVNRVYNQHAIETLLHLARPFIKFDVQLFSQAPMALSWLLENKPGLPELLAEWDAPSTPPGPDASEVAEPRASYGPQ